jgi:hypothetical protein
MILIYVDESGTGLGDRRSPFFLLAAVAIPASKWVHVDSQVSALKRRLITWARAEDLEIKGRDMRRGDKFFKGLDWTTRVAAIQELAELISTLPCRIFGVQVDKRELPDSVSSEDLMYRLAFSRLLDKLEEELSASSLSGMLMLDSRSDLHTSVQDRRLIDAYREWVASRQGRTSLVELPWFGFSAFYVGLQLADFCAYLIDFVSNEGHSLRGQSELADAYSKMERKVELLRIP